MSIHFPNFELEAFLDEALPVERMTAIEESLRSNVALQKQLAAVSGRRDAGVHSLGEIWRRHRLSCASRQQLGSYLLGVLPQNETDYITFHIEAIECRYCTANLADLKAQQSAAETDTVRRRQKYFQSSVGHLRKRS